MIRAERNARVMAEANAAVVKAEAANAQADLSSSEALNAHLKLEIEKLRRELYGSRSERKARLLEQMELQLEDLETAHAIIQEDDTIDECYSRLYDEAIHSFLDNPKNIERANYVIWVAHNLERLGDRVTNVCERVIYIVTGERPELDILPQEELKLSVGV
jgi:Na+/phosphate symporter